MAREQKLSVPNSFFIYGRDLNGDGRDDLVLRYENVPGRDGEIAIALSR